MDDIEQALSELPQEPPPPEIVLAAVRTFRYRAVATVASIIAAVLLLGLVGRSIGAANLDAEVASLGGGTAVPIFAEADYDGIHVSVSELVWDDGVGFLRLLAWDTGSHAQVMIEPVAITTSAGRRIELEPDTVLSLVNFATPQGEQIDQRADAGWIKFSDPNHDPHGSFALEVRLEEVPLEIVLEGGVFSGPFPTLIVQHEGTDL